MSVMTARYAGTCTSCGTATHVGDRVRWTRGSGVRHTTTAACDEALSEQRSEGTSCCGDYHYADCPTRTGGSEQYYNDYEEDWR